MVWDPPFYLAGRLPYKWNTNFSITWKPLIRLEWKFVCRGFGDEKGSYDGLRPPSHLAGAGLPYQFPHNSKTTKPIGVKIGMWGFWGTGKVLMMIWDPPSHLVGGSHTNETQINEWKIIFKEIKNLKRRWILKATKMLITPKIFEVKETLCLQKICIIY